MHNEKIIHRDLKLSNIILKEANNPIDFKIVDFGLSTHMNMK